MPQKQGRIKVHGQGEVEVELVAAYLADLKHAYDSVLVFEGVIAGLPGRALRAPPSKKEVSSLIPHSEQLILSAVQLSSPGFWEFLGNLNSLEVIRQYLNDRHEMRKDREYRESVKKRRLILENLKLENEVIAEHVRLAKELGATDGDLVPLLNELLYKPLVALDRHQDKGVIEYAEISHSQQEREGKLKPDRI